MQNQRERYIKTLTFGNPDKIPLMPGEPRESTIATWRTQGLPEGKNYFSMLLEVLGIEPNKMQKSCNLEGSFQMMPKHEEKVLSHKNGHYIVRDWLGAKTEISDMTKNLNLFIF